MESDAGALLMARLTVISFPGLKPALAASVWLCCCVQVTISIRARCSSSATASLPSSFGNRWARDGIKRLTVNPSSIPQRRSDEKENSLWLELWIQPQPACLIYRTSGLQLLNHMNQTCDPQSHLRAHKLGFSTRWLQKSLLSMYNTKYFTRRWKQAWKAVLLMFQIGEYLG